MSKKKRNRRAAKRKRKTKSEFQNKGNSQNGEAKVNTSLGNNVLTVGNNKEQKQDETQTDQTPSTSRDSQKQKSPVKKKTPSPWRNAGGKVNKFRKIVDNQARKLIKRSVYLTRDIQTPKKRSPLNKTSKRYFNNSNVNRKMKVKSKIKDIHSDTTLEEGEIRTDEDSDVISTSKYNGEDENDCIVIEPSVDEITIDDEDDNDNIPSSSVYSKSYQSLVHSFKERFSSTPFCKNYSNASVAQDYRIDSESQIERLPFFVDICGRRSGFESINSTDTFNDYSKLSTLGDKSIFKHRRVRLKENDCSEVIDLVGSQKEEQSLTLKEDSNEEDDSVIFVGETNKNDFISIVDDTLKPQKISEKSETPNTPINRQRINNNSLFTVSETKQLNEYNENAYNPDGYKTLTNIKRLVIIDGSNLAFKHGLDQSFSVKGLKIAIEYFEKMGHEVKAVIPQFRMNKGKSSDPEELERLHRKGKIVQTPCKNLPGFTGISYDDRFILQLAFELDAAIVSNDNYRDLLHENPAFKKIIENRVIGYTWCNDIFILPKDPYGKWGPTLHQILNR